MLGSCDLYLLPIKLNFIQISHSYWREVWKVSFKSFVSFHSSFFNANLVVLVEVQPSGSGHCPSYWREFSPVRHHHRRLSSWNRKREKKGTANQMKYVKNQLLLRMKISLDHLVAAEEWGRTQDRLKESMMSTDMYLYRSEKIWKDSENIPKRVKRASGVANYW